ncbi:histidine kinase [Microbacterium sp. R86528]|uniref:histidine kinase n=1 Tax=Microbacterium sp. R86528 TaxID=3093864 RepID=UPI0037C64436
MSDDDNRVMPMGPRARVPAWLVDVLLIALMVPLTLVRDPSEGVIWPDDVTVVLAALTAAALPFRRRWPQSILGLELAGYAAAAVLGALVPAHPFAIAVAIFAVTNRVARRDGLLVTVVTVVLVIGLGLLAWQGSPTDPRLVQFALTVTVGSALGDAARSRREYIEAITDRAERAERTREAEARRCVSEERLRIARDLHDAVAHQISVISLNAGGPQRPSMTVRRRRRSHLRQSARRPAQYSARSEACWRCSARMTGTRPPRGRVLFGSTN